MIRPATPLLLALALASCGRSVRARAERPPETDEQRAVGVRLDAYTKCLEHAERVFQIADTYREQFGNAAPTTDSESPVQASEDPETCIDAIVEVSALAPAQPELDAAAVAYGKALRRVHAVTTAVHDYYDRANSSYAPSKGVALHGALMAAFGGFDAAQGALFDQVFWLNRKVHADQLAAREKTSPRDVAIVADNMMLRAEDLVRLVGVGWKQLDKVDATAVAERLARFERSYEELEGLVLGGSQSEDVTRGYWAIKKPAQQYSIAARQLIARVRENLPYTDAERIMIEAKNEESVVGTPEAIVDTYNRLVEASYLLVSR